MKNFQLGLARALFLLARKFPYVGSKIGKFWGSLSVSQSVSQISTSNSCISIAFFCHLAEFFTFTYTSLWKSALIQLNLHIENPVQSDILG